MHVLVPLGDTVREVAESVWGDVDAACGQPVSLLRGECPVVPDDVLDRICHQPSPSDVVQVVDAVRLVRQWRHSGFFFSSPHTLNNPAAITVMFRVATSHCAPRPSRCVTPFVALALSGVASVGNVERRRLQDAALKVTCPPRSVDIPGDRVRLRAASRRGALVADRSRDVVVGGCCRSVWGAGLLARYVEFVAGRCRPNTVLATVSDLKAFFTVIDRSPSRWRRRTCSSSSRRSDGAGRAALLRGGRTAARGSAADEPAGVHRRWQGQFFGSLSNYLSISGPRPPVTRFSWC